MLESTLDESVASPDRRRSTLALGVFFAVLIVVMAALILPLRNVDDGLPLDSGPAPDITLTGFDGETVSLSELRGKVVVINIWASWCVPCRDEAAYLERVWQRYRDRGVFFIGVNYQDREAAARAFLEEYGVSYFNGPDVEARIGRAYEVQGVPETFYVGKDGELYGMRMGALQPPELELKLEELLAAPAPEDRVTGPEVP